VLYIRLYLLTGGPKRVAKVPGNAASGTTWATGRELRHAASLEDLLAARQRLFDAGDTDAASSLTEVICARLRDQGDLAGAAALGQGTLDAMPTPSASAARWLHELGTLAQLSGDDAQAQDRHLRAVQMFTEVGDPAGVARSYDSLGTLAHARGDYAQAEQYYQAATCLEVPQPLPAQAQPLAEPQPPRLEPPHAESVLTDLGPAGAWLAAPLVSEAAAAGTARASATRTRTAPVGPARAELRPAGAEVVPPPAVNGRRHPDREGRRAGGMWAGALAAGAIVLAAAVAIAITAADGSAGVVANRASPAKTGLIGSPPAAAGGDRVQAAAWVARQISSSAVVGCDPAMCDALRAQGVATGNLLVIGAGGQSDPLGSNIVVSTAAVRGTLGARLAQVYAPLILARFGTGSARIEVRVTAPDGSAAYLRALLADRAARVTAGRQLLANRQLSESAGARRELADGGVDSRLLISIAALTDQRRVRIVAFAASGPGADPRVPLPSAEIAAAGPGRAGAALRVIAAFFRAQRSPYLADVISLTRLPSGQPVLRVAFGEPGPPGLLGAGG
jgi:hypothetical protein